MMAAQSTGTIKYFRILNPKKIKIKNSPNNKTRCKLGAYGCTNNISLIFYIE
jgi:hypothetical protein